MMRDEDTRVVEGYTVLSGGVNAEGNLRHHPDVPCVSLLAPRPGHPPPRLLEPRLHLGDVLGSPRARRPRREDILRRLRRLRMQPKLPDDDVGERPGPRPLERVPVCVVREDAVRRPRDVIANLSQRRVPRRAREHPVEHLPSADEVPAVRHLIRSELVLPAHNQGIRAPEVRIHRLPALRVYVRVHPAGVQHDQVPEEIAPLHILGQRHVRVVVLRELPLHELVALGVVVEANLPARVLLRPRSHEPLHPVGHVGGLVRLVDDPRDHQRYRHGPGPVANSSR
mmetsp:Transcript_821/g.3413  ORF Transcript_821/g.3413 Transcript_821/m.3413 type:complete len:283 (+) Transcript_821:324-1172(+)